MSNSSDKTTEASNQNVPNPSEKEKTDKIDEINRKTDSINPADKTSVNSNKIEELKDDIESIDPEIWEGIPEDKKTKIVELISTTIRVEEQTHSGPIPDAESLAKYDVIIPNGADRIMIMAEKQQEHRLIIEKLAIKSNNSQSKKGQIFGFILCLLAILSGTFLTYLGYSKVGGILLGATVVSLATIFVIGKYKQTKRF